jgi:predicted NUDIX family NTP pyrophosphohydrolase
MGGPFWQSRRAAAWSAPKGGVEPGETPEDAAEREFQEETGLQPPQGPRVPLGSSVQRSGKTVRLWAVEADPDLAGFRPCTFPMEWPRGSGQVLQVPELDRLAWVTPSEADTLLVAGQRPFIARVLEALPPLPSRV